MMRDSRACINVPSLLGLTGGLLAAPVGLAFDDELAGAGLQPVDGGLGKQRVGEPAEPLDRLAAGGQQRCPGQVPLDRDFVEVTGGNGVEGVQGDIGLLPVTTETAEALYRVVDAAYEKRSIALSSNLHPAGFDELMPKSIANATVDRLMHHAHLVSTNGAQAHIA